MIDVLLSLSLIATNPECDPELGCIITDCTNNDSIYCKSNQSRTAVTQVNINAVNLPVIPAGTTVRLIRTFQTRNAFNELVTLHEISWNGHNYIVNSFEIKIN